MIVFDKFENSLDFQKDFTPDNIWKYYLFENEFIFLNTSNVKNIPIIRHKHESLQKTCHKYKFASYHFSTLFDKYAEGFLKGFATEFKPFIQTPENQKEMILKAIMLGISENPVRHRENSDGNLILFLDEKSLFLMGEKMGKNYKAWTLLLETPKYFENEPLFENRTASMRLGLGPFKSMESLYIAAQVRGIITEQHPIFREHDLLFHKGRFTQWLIDNFDLKDIENIDPEYFISLLTINNFKKYLESDKLANQYLKPKINNTINPINQILDIKAQIVWLEEQLSNLKEKNKETIFLNVQLTTFNYAIDNALKKFPENPNAKFSETTNNSIIGLKKYLNEIEEKLKCFSLNEAKENSEQKIRLEPKTFEELFVDSFNKDLHEACIDVLRKVKPALINAKNKYIKGRLLGAFCLWIKIMEELEVLEEGISRKHHVKILCTMFEGLSIDESMFSENKIHKKAEEKYRKKFTELITEIKYSKLSKK